MSPAAAKAAVGAELLATDNLCIQFGGLRAVDKVKLCVRDGEIVGLIGPNGAGKTTCFYMITGVYKPTEGEIRLGGSRIDDAEDLLDDMTIGQEILAKAFTWTVEFLRHGHQAVPRVLA